MNWIAKRGSVRAVDDRSRSAPTTRMRQQTGGRPARSGQQHDRAEMSKMMGRAGPRRRPPRLHMPRHARRPDRRWGWKSNSHRPLPVLSGRSQDRVRRPRVAVAAPAAVMVIVPRSGVAHHAACPIAPRRPRLDVGVPVGVAVATVRVGVVMEVGLAHVNHGRTQAEGQSCHDEQPDQGSGDGQTPRIHAGTIAPGPDRDQPAPRQPRVLTRDRWFELPWRQQPSTRSPSSLRGARCGRRDRRPAAGSGQRVASRRIVGRSAADRRSDRRGESTGITTPVSRMRTRRLGPDEDWEPTRPPTSLAHDPGVPGLAERAGIGSWVRMGLRWREAHPATWTGGSGSRPFG